MCLSCGRNWTLSPATKKEVGLNNTKLLLRFGEKNTLLFFISILLGEQAGRHNEQKNAEIFANMLLRRGFATLVENNHNTWAQHVSSGPFLRRQNRQKAVLRIIRTAQQQ